MVAPKIADCISKALAGGEGIYPPEEGSLLASQEEMQKA